VVIFSPGGGPNPVGHLTHEEWGTRLASVGYAVIHMAHPLDDPSGHCAPLGIPPAECTETAITSGTTVGAIWYDRPRDASAVIDNLAGIEAASGARFDRSRIGIAGHSGGAHTVMSTAGIALDWSPSVRGVVYREPRIRAFLANSPQGVGDFGVTATSWASIAPPVMVTTGAADSAPATPDPAARLQPFERMPPPDKYQLYLDSPGAVHNVFGLNAAEGAGNRPLTPLEEYVWVSGLAFLDAYVRGFAAARAWLQSQQVEGWSEGVATISRK
jgi:predicted dienelactone hydrolase